MSARDCRVSNRLSKELARYFVLLLFSLYNPLGIVCFIFIIAIFIITIVFQFSKENFFTTTL